VVGVLFFMIMAFGKLFRVPVPVDNSTLKFMLRRHGYSIDKARRVLGYRPRITLEEGMREVEQFLREQGIRQDRHP